MTDKGKGGRRRGDRGSGRTTGRFTVARAESGRTLASLLKAHQKLSWSEARRLIRGRRVKIGPAICADPERRLRVGERVEVTWDATGKQAPPRRDRAGLADPVLRHLDEHIVVVDKPAGLTTMRHAHEAAEFGGRARRYLPPTLEDLLPSLIARKSVRPARPRAVHRLDKETSGLVVFALTPAAARHLGAQFRRHEVGRTYLALVRGVPEDGRIESHLQRDRGDGRRGSARQAGAGQRAVTHIRVVEPLGAFALVECRLETGRTHQVRIHLGERGAPLCGERVYDRPPHGSPIPDGSGAARPCLHAATLALTHPATGDRLEWSSPLPPDMAALLEKLRRGKSRESQGGSEGPAG